VGQNLGHSMTLGRVTDNSADKPALDAWGYLFAVLQGSEWKTTFLITNTWQENEAVSPSAAAKPDEPGARAARWQTATSSSVARS